MSAFQTRQPALTAVQSRSRSRSKSRNRDRSRIAASSCGTQLLIELQTATCIVSNDCRRLLDGTVCTIPSILFILSMSLGTPVCGRSGFSGER